MSDQNEIPIQGVDELDDVEGHGLKEVAAVAGFGAVVIGGGAAAAATSMHGPGPTPVVRPPAVVAQTQSDANKLIADAAQGAGGVAGQTVQDARALTGHTVSQATSIVAPEVTLANTTVHGVEGVERQTVSDATSLADHEVNATTHLARQTETTAYTTVSKTETAAVRQVSSVERTTIQVVKATEDRIGNGWTLDLSVLGMHANTGGNMLAPNGTVNVLDDQGRTIASAKVLNGAATVHFNVLGAQQTFTIHYTGSSTYASVDIPWLSPKP